MSPIVEQLRAALSTNAPPSALDIERLKIKISPANDVHFIEFYTACNGGSGLPKEDAPLLLWKIEEIDSLNPYYDDVESCFAFVFFGTDGSNNGYALHKETGKIVTIGFMEIGYEEPTEVASNFESFALSLLNK